MLTEQRRKELRELADASENANALARAIPELLAEIRSLRAHCEAMAGAIEGSEYEDAFDAFAAYRADYPVP